LAHARGNRRDKIAVLTTNGLHVRAFAQQKLAHVEARLETRIGKEKLETLRQILTDRLADDVQENR
jgi:DNA-binding MarR family transcriptional regulator